MRVLDLFSGIGGFSLGLERAGMETVAFCEIEKFPQKVLKKHWPEVPIYDDIRKLTREQLTKDGIGTVDLVCGGFPCQPFSQAGKREGFQDDRDLWPEMFRVIQEVRPRWVIGENVAGFVNMGLDRTLSDLEGAGYRTEQVIIPACAVGANHRRDRIWVIASDSKSFRDRRGCGYLEKEKGTERKGGKGNAYQEFKYDCEDVAHSKLKGLEGLAGDEPDRDKPGRNGEKENGSVGSSGVRNPTKQGLQDRPEQKMGESGEITEPKRPNWWAVEPPVGRVAHGVPKRVDRLKGLGNAVVPQIPEIIGRAIMEVEFENKNK